ncbi:hypothetical protein DPEC_G00303490 [Dallia pectoralis]|uniref:Uncharacterized protein n=1 Tax=Dallia pectoralis TaxID=75939 RepID=A0ACC2FDB8_DALPE|nr:hypothetical protein DPEC_G00303490 [Dallia pectoralis]
MELHLVFLMVEERELTAELIDELREKKKQLYLALAESIMNSMLSCYKRASRHTGKDALKRMRHELHRHVRKEDIFQKAMDDMLKRLNELKEHIVKKLKSKIIKSIEISLKTPNSLDCLDVTEDYNNVKECFAAVQSGMSGKGCKQVQTMKTPAFNVPGPSSMPDKSTPLNSKCNNPTDAVQKKIPDAVKKKLSHVEIVKKNRIKLIQRVTNVTIIADELLQDEKIQYEMYEQIQTIPVTGDKMRLLLERVIKGGENVTSAFCDC